MSQATKQRLKNLFDSDVLKLAMEGDKGDKHLTFLSKTYPIGVLEGMGPNCFSNTPFHVYQRERDCEGLRSLFSGRGVKPVEEFLFSNRRVKSVLSDRK